jgi:hypothetical protein
LKHEGSWRALCLCEILLEIGKNFYWNFQMLKLAYKADCWSCTQCTNVPNTAERPLKTIQKLDGPSTTTDNDHVCVVICENCCLTVCEVSEEVGISRSSCHTILTEELEMHHVATCNCSYVVPCPWILGDAQDDCHLPATLLSSFVPCRLSLFMRLKSTLKGRWFLTIEEIEENLLRDLRTILQTHSRTGKNVGSIV